MTILDLITSFFTAHDYLAYLVLFLASYLETFIGIGFFVYGEFFFLAGAILAGIGLLNIWVVSFACILGGLLGDSSSFYIGKKYGTKIFKYWFNKDNKYLTIKNYEKGVKFFHSHGKKSIFFARLLGPLSWVTPFLSGTLKIKYKDFIKYNLPGVIVGIGIFMVVGYFFGFSYSAVLHTIRKDVFYSILVIIMVFLFLLLRKLEVVSKINAKVRRN